MQAMIVTVLLALLPMATVVSLIVYTKRRITEINQNPINTDLLRNPGQSLLEQIEDINVDIHAYLLVLSVTPLMLYAYYLQSKVNIFATVLFILTGLVAVVWFGLKTLKLVNQKTKLRLGYDAELAVGQELNILMHDGYWVFHDVPANNYNIDHVVVGSNGVFAVETKARSKSVAIEGKEKSKVTFDGNQLIFPTWTETAPLEQAKRQANSLQKELSSAVGEPVKVKPVLAIPGWFIENMARSEIAFISGKNYGSTFKKLSNQPLDDQQILRIRHQLDQRCRNVRPQAYQEESK